MNSNILTFTEIIPYLDDLKGRPKNDVILDLYYNLLKYQRGQSFKKSKKRNNKTDNIFLLLSGDQERREHLRLLDPEIDEIWIARLLLLAKRIKNEKKERWILTFPKTSTILERQASLNALIIFLRELDPEQIMSFPASLDTKQIDLLDSIFDIQFALSLDNAIARKIVVEELLQDLYEFKERAQYHHENETNQIQLNRVVETHFIPQQIERLEDYVYHPRKQRKQM